MPLLSEYARKRKVSYFIENLSRNARILEVGCGDGWFGLQLRRAGYTNYVGLDLKGPADVVGDILQWKSLGLQPQSFDVIIAFELIEHVDCFQELFDLLKPGGLLMLTSPVPHMDWACKLLEYLGMNQKRTSPHDHLLYFKSVPMFEPLQINVIAGMAQWGKFRKPARG
jgi:2-polyprenyl-3-methyl-5-hydroxy-6-metoxy-1,4-benzoquinol methylase